MEKLELSKTDRKEIADAVLDELLASGSFQAAAEVLLEVIDRAMGMEAFEKYKANITLD